MKGLKKARTDIQMSQVKLAELLGVTVVMISRYENGVALPSMEKLFKIADILGVSVDFLVKGE